MKTVEREVFDNNSPWLRSLYRNREVAKFSHDDSSDIVVVGAGISGVLTCYYLLKNTKKSIILIDKGLVGHGATGYNAGQVVDYFERSITNIVKHFGIRKTIKAQKELIGCWRHLRKIIDTEKLKTRLSIFDGLDYYKKKEVLDVHIKDELLLRKFGVKKKSFFYLDNMDYPIGKKIRELDEGFIAYAVSKKGLMSSASFSEELVGVMLKRFKDRFKLYEDSKVNNMVFDKSCRIFSNHQIVCGSVILCTNGYEDFEIDNDRFHKNIFSIVGYMAGYLDKNSHEEDAISYYDGLSKNKEFRRQDSYVYITKRRFIHKNIQNTLICYGEPEHHLRDKEEYDKNKHYIRKPEKLFMLFHHKLDFIWHGLMGYTYNGLRIIGRDKKNSKLYYNLGCNGAGILTSVLGARMISEIINHKKMNTIFDP